MNKPLKSEEQACNSYIQESTKCKNCLRNIGFYSETHKNWGKFELKSDNSCDGFISK